MKIIEGDLIKLAVDKQFDLIIHGCNCFCTMGAGIALSIRNHFPEAYEADSNTQTGDKEKLGSFSFATVTRGNHTITIVNAYTQYHWDGEGVLLDYTALEKCLRAIKIKFTGKRIGYPKIGAGLARGDWERIQTIIDKTLSGEDHCLVVKERCFA